MASSDMSFWISFFKEAGIPPGDAANYAVTFTDNRISRTMLLDLTKDYLNDMGIAILGDVIAILKHAKTVYNQDVRDRVLRDTSATQETPALKRSTPASRTLDHYLRSAERSSSPLMSTSPKLSKEMSARLGSPSTAVVPDVQQSLSILRLRVNKPVQKEDVPVPKKNRRVFPEDEGHYTINMPQGSTSRTKKILAQQRQQSELQRIRAEEEKKRVASKKTSVFSRLGSEKPKSSPAPGSSTQPTVTITGLGSINMPTTSGTPQSIFARLGGKTTVKRAATSTVSFDDDDDDLDIVSGAEQLGYAGVLKSSPSPEKKPKLAAVAAQRIKKSAHKKLAAKKVAEPPKTAGVLASRSSSSLSDIRSRLGPKVPEVSSTTQPHVVSTTKTAAKPAARVGVTKSQLDKITITVARSTKSAAKSSVKSSKPASTTVTSGVFSRLGKPKP